MSNWNFVYKDPASIFTKIINAQQHYVQICYTEFHQNHKINVESMDRNSFAPVSKARFPLDILSQKSQLPKKIFADSFYNEFYNHRMKNAENTDINFNLRHQVKCADFQENSQPPNGIKWRFPMPNFIQVRLEICGVRDRIQLRPYAQNESLSRFSRHSCMFRHFCKELLHGI
jgi:hypothetical protein